MPNLIDYIALGIASLCSALASILLTGAASIPLLPITIASVTPRFAALMVYGIGFMLYGYALRALNVSAAYPIMVGITVIILFLYSFLRGEVINSRIIMGAAAVILGIILLTKNK